MSAPIVYRAGQQVELFNAHGLKVVGVNCGGKRIHVPNPTRAEVLYDWPQTAPLGPVNIELRILDGPFMGSIVEAFPLAVRAIISPPD